MPILEIAVQHAGDERVVCLQGELDMSEAARVRDTLAGASGRTVVDLAEVTFIDAAGLGAILSARTDLRRRGHQLVLRNPNPRVRIVFELADLTQLLEEDPPTGR